MNTLNFFLTPDNPGSDRPTQVRGGKNLECRGADASQGEEFTRQRDKLLATLAGLGAEIIGLNEMENTPGVDPLGDPGRNRGWAQRDARVGPYAAINTGVIGTDAIRVGLIYRSARVMTVGPYEILKSTDDPRFIDTGADRSSPRHSGRVRPGPGSR